MRLLFFKQKTADELRSSDWSSDVCSSDLKLAREANEKKTQDEKISELRQRDANLRNAANQLVTTEQSYDTSLRGGWPNFISGWLPSPETGAFNKNAAALLDAGQARSEEHTSELQSLMRISYAVFCLKKQKK